MKRFGFGLIAASVLLSASVCAVAGELVAKAPTAKKKPALSGRDYNRALVEKDKVLREKRAKLQGFQAAAARRKAAMLKSNPECAKLVVEIAALEKELAAKQAKLDGFIGSDPDLQRLSKEIDVAETAVKTDHAAIQEFIRQRKQLEWGAKKHAIHTE